MSDPNSTPDPNAVPNEQQQPFDAQSADFGAEQLKAIIGALQDDLAKAKRGTRQGEDRDAASRCRHG